MKSLLFGIGVAIAAVAAAVAAASAVWVFWDAYKASDLESFKALVGGFGGAFFAYLFVRFGDALKKVYDRKEKNHSTVVRLQHYFNDCLNTTADNLFIADDCIKIFDEKRLQTGEHPIYMNVFHSYPVDREILIGLTNIDFLNEVFTLNVELNKLNDSLATVDRAYGQIRDAFIAKHIGDPDYVNNARLTRERCAEVKGFLLQTKQDLIRLFAVANLLLKDPPFLVRVIRALTKTRYPRNFKSSLEREMVRVAAEIEAIGRQSAERIAAARSSVAQQPVAADAPQAARR
jgi:hypothetical protein